MVSLSLILAIGSQNAFVLRQGIRGEHVALICLTCAFSDAVLILGGVMGLKRVIATIPWLKPLMIYAGAAFLIVYGVKSLMAALSSAETLRPSEQTATALLKTLGTCLAFTWLNPHVYLDTVFLTGSVSTRFPGREAVFAMGAMSASFVFFFALGYGAAILRPLFEKPVAWRVLEGSVALVMWGIAVNLLVRP